MQNKPLMLYVNPAWKRKGLHTPLLFPFWGNPTEEISLFTKELFDSFSFDTSLYGITDDIGAADMVLPTYRHNWFLRHDKALLEECARTAREAGLPLLVDGVGDIEFPLNIANAFVLRIGGYRFMERCVGGQLHIRKKKEGRPTVGFAGWAKLTPKQYLRTVLKELPMRLRGLYDSRYRSMTKGVLWRKKAIELLHHSPLVGLNLRVRGSFSGSARTAEGDMRVLRQQLVDTVLESDYALDARGDANESIRLYEILSLGRIPVIIDTERNFPFCDAVDYRSFSLMVDHRDLGRLPEIIAGFHAHVSPEQYETMQRKAREAFVHYFRVDAQMRQIIRQLPKVR